MKPAAKPGKEIGDWVPGSRKSTCNEIPNLEFPNFHNSFSTHPSNCRIKSVR